MANNFEFDCAGHNSIYTKNYLNDNYNKRKFKVYFSTPTNGVNSETGVLLFAAGFGGNANSNIYKKMRQDFADKYNLTTIQCDYFGSEFMQNNFPLNYSKESLNLLKEYDLINESGTLNLSKLQNINQNLNLSATAILEESIENFNDMSYMQAIDNITAVLNVLGILYNNNYSFNTNKIIIMGQSHGSYLSYLCNVMCKGLFTHILDNSAWTYPCYLDSFRCLSLVYGNNASIFTTFSYLSQKMRFNIDYLKLSNLYKDVYNTCSIVSYHGKNDTLAPLNNKILELLNINNIELNVISTENLNEGIFTNDSHGLGADFNKLFDSFYTQYITDIELNSTLHFENNVVLNGSNLRIDYTTGLPIVVNLGELFYI